MIRIYAQTHTGMVREGNEDSFLVIDTTSESADHLPDVREVASGEAGITLMVSDGMGGAAAGEVASSLAVTTVMKEMQFSRPPEAKAFVEQLDHALQSANRVISEHTRQHPEMQGMGATATAAGILKDRAFIGQVGDSRAYLIRKQQIRQVTRDQSFVNQLVEAGKITEEEAERHPRRNVILQALGNQARMEVVFSDVPLRQGDYLLLCSDGLSGLVNKEEICQIVLDAPDLPQACQQLIDLANQRGGHDNITVILAQFTNGTLSPPADGEDDIKTGYPSLGEFLKNLPEKSRRKWGFFTRTHRITLLSVLGFVVACAVLALWIWKDKKHHEQYGQIRDRLQSIGQARDFFIKDQRDLLEMLPDSEKLLADSLEIGQWIERSRKMLENDRLAQARVMADSASQALARWKASLQQALLTISTDRQAAAASVRKLWVQQLEKHQEKAAAINASVALLSRDELKKLPALSLEQLRTEVQRYVDAIFLETYAYIQYQVADFRRTLGKKDPLHEVLDSKLKMVNRLHQTAAEKIYDDNPILVKEGFKAETLALDIMAEIKSTLEKQRGKPARMEKDTSAAGK